MPIAPPSFNISPISIPARRARRDPLSSILSQIIGLSLQSRFNQEAAEAANVRALERDRLGDVAASERVAAVGALAAERDLASDLASGRVERVTPTDLTGLFRVPEALPDVGGIFDLPEGEFFASRGEVQQVTPFEEFAGRPTREGTSVADVTDPTTGVFSPTLAAGFAEGDLAGTIAAVEAMERDPSISPAVTAASRAALESALADPSGVSLAEQEALGRPRPVLANFDELLRRHYQDDIDMQSAVAVNESAIVRSIEIQEMSAGGQMIRRDLRGDERFVYAKQLSGANLSPEEETLLQGFLSNVRNRVTNVDRQEVMVQAIDRASVTGSDDWADFVRRINAVSADSPELRAEMRKSSRVTDSLSDTAASDFASDPGASSFLRLGYGLIRAGFLRRSAIQENLRSGAVYNSIDIRSAMDAAALLIPGFNDVPLDPRFGGSGSPAAPQTLGQADQGRQTAGTIADNAGTVFGGFTVTERSEIVDNLRSASPQELMDRASNLRRSPSSTSEAEKQKDEALASWLESLAAISTASPDAYRTLLDSLGVALQGR